ncbi:MAG: branched-chain amino acid aminotransferase [Pseudomonadota bacterium]
MPSFDQRDGYIWLDGQLVAWREAQLHVLSHGLHYASCVFEGNRAYNGEIFRLTDHSQRLIDSAMFLDMSIPYSRDELDEACQQVLRANNLTDGYLRPVAWRGSEMMAVSAQDTTIHVAIAAWTWPSYFNPEIKTRGIRMQTSSWRRPAPDTSPTQAKWAGGYAILTLAKHRAEKEGYQDALTLDYRGNVAEATGANIFLIIDGVLHTPDPDSFLNGLTRQTILTLAQELQIPVRVRRIAPAELAQAQEVFIVGTAAEVTPVGCIDDLTFTPGDITKRLSEAYSDTVRSKPAKQ